MNVADATALFRRVLENPSITPASNFFDEGGDSLLATRVLSAVARTHGRELTFDDFLLAPTPADLAAAVAAGPPAPGVAAGPVDAGTGTLPDSGAGGAR